MTPAEWAGFAVAIMTLVAGFAAAVRWLVKHYFSELKPNSGSSMRDEVKVNSLRLERVETEQSHQSKRIDDIYKMLLELLKDK